MSPRRRIAPVATVTSFGRGSHQARRSDNGRCGFPVPCSPTGRWSAPWPVGDGRYTRVERTYGAGSHPYTEWDDLLRLGQSYDWRGVRRTSGPSHKGDGWRSRSPGRVSHFSTGEQFRPLPLGHI
jgi:hypothetical protein